MRGNGRDDGLEEKNKLLDLAEAWLKLADDTAKTAVKVNGGAAANKQ